MIYLVKEIIHTEPYKLTLRFNTGEIRRVNLEGKLKEWGASPQSKFAELKDATYFNSVKLDTEIESLVWPNGIDLCPDVLYNLSEEINKKNVA